MRFDARAILLLVNLVLLTAIGLLFSRPHGGWQAPKPLPPVLDDVVSGGQFFMFDLKNMSLNAITEKPLFWSSRRPIPPQPKKVPPPKPKANPLKGAKLLGTFASGSAAGAVLRVEGKKKPKVLRLVVGDSYRNMTLQKVSPDSADFVDQKSGLSQTLTLAVAPQSQYHASPEAASRQRAFAVQRRRALRQAAKSASADRKTKKQSATPPRDPWVPPPPKPHK